MKKSKMGFTLLETLIVSTFIASTLIYLFVQISNIKTSYDITFRYDTVPGLYGAQSITQYLADTTYEELRTNLNNSSSHYVDITDGTAILNGSNLYYRDLVKKLDAKMIIFINENTTDIINSLDSINVFDEEMKKYIKKIDSNKNDKLYRIVIEYNDNTFASVKLGAGSYTAYAIGDQVTVAGETWYVIKDSVASASTITLLKATNIDGNNYVFDAANARTTANNSYCAQPQYGCNAYTKVTGTYTNGTKSGTVTGDSTIKGLVDNYVNSLNLGINLKEARLITNEELEDLGCNSLTKTCTTSKYAWTYATRYWTGTPEINNTFDAWGVDSSGIFDSDNGCFVNYFGIRPVIVVNKLAIS